MNPSNLPKLKPVEHKVTSFEIPAVNIEEIASDTGCGLICKLLNKIHKPPFKSEQPSGGSSSNEEMGSIVVTMGESVSNETGWVYQEFNKHHPHIPSVVATAEYKLANFIERHVPQIHEINVPELKLAKLNVHEIELPRITIERVHLYTYKCNNCEYAWATIHEANQCPKCGSTNISELIGEHRFSELGWYSALYAWTSKVGNWGPLNWLRDDIMTPLAWVCYTLTGKDHIYALLDVIDKYISEIEGKINYTAEEVSSHIIKPINNLIYDLTTEVEDKVNSLAEDLAQDIVNPVNDVIDEINNVFAHIQKDLYKIWNIPDGYGLAPVHVRNLTNGSFEWLSLGPMKVHFIALSRR